MLLTPCLTDPQLAYEAEAFDEVTEVMEDTVNPPNPR